MGNEAGAISYPVSVNGKMKMNLPLALDIDAKAVEEIVLANAYVQRYLDGKPVKKLIFVKGKIINIVV